MYSVCMVIDYLVKDVIALASLRAMHMYTIALFMKLIIMKLTVALSVKLVLYCQIMLTCNVLIVK